MKKNANSKQLLINTIKKLYELGATPDQTKVMLDAYTRGRRGENSGNATNIAQSFYSAGTKALAQEKAQSSPSPAKKPRSLNRPGVVYKRPSLSQS